MKIQIKLENLTKENLNIDGDIYAEDSDGVHHIIYESKYLLPLVGRDAPAHEPKDLVITGPLNEVFDKFLEHFPESDLEHPAIDLV